MTLNTIDHNDSISTQQHNFSLPTDRQLQKWGKLNEVNILKMQDAGMAARLVAMIEGMKDNDLSGRDHLKDYSQYAVAYTMSEFGPREKDLNHILTEIATLPVAPEMKEAISSEIKKEIEHNKDKPRFSDRKKSDANTNAAEIEKLKALL